MAICVQTSDSLSFVSAVSVASCSVVLISDNLTLSYLSVEWSPLYRRREREERGGGGGRGKRGERGGRGGEEEEREGEERRNMVSVSFFFWGYNWGEPE